MTSSRGSMGRSQACFEAHTVHGTVVWWSLMMVDARIEFARQVLIQRAAARHIHDLQTTAYAEHRFVVREREDFIRVIFGKEDAVLREFKWTGVLFDETRGCSRSSSTSGITAITGFIHILLMLESAQPRPNLSGFGITTSCRTPSATRWNSRCCASRSRTTNRCSAYAVVCKSGQHPQAFTFVVDERHHGDHGFHPHPPHARRPSRARCAPRNRNATVR